MSDGTDLGVIGQLAAAAGVLPVFASGEKIAEFLAPLMAGVPGCSRAGVCLRGFAGPYGLPAGERCRGCAGRTGMPAGGARYRCALAGEAGIRACPVETADGVYGYLVLEVSDAAEYGKYEPFLKNLAGGLALTLENRRQRDALLEEKRLLELRVRERTSDLQKAHAALVEKNRELEEIMYAASHDLRAPLVNIKGFSENIAKYIREIREALSGGGPNNACADGRLGDLLDKDIPEAMGFISGSIAKMSGLLGAMLKVSRAGSAKLVIAEINMDELLKFVLASLAFQIQEAGAEVKAGPLPRCLGDRLRLSQVFSNLIENSLNYRHPARRLVLEITGATAADGMADYTVADNGLGITEEEAAGKIWGLFYRAHPGKGAAGEGIGLTVAKRIVERHGGGITASSVEGGGARFTIRLRTAKDPHPPED